MDTCPDRVDGKHLYRPIEAGDIARGLKASTLRDLVGQDGVICQVCGQVAPNEMLRLRVALKETLDIADAMGREINTNDRAGSDAERERLNARIADLRKEFDL